MIWHYEHPEYFVDWYKPDLKQYSGKLVLWGAGRIGGIAAHCLKKQSIEFLAYVDIASDKWGTEFCGHKIISPQQLKETFPEVAVLVSSSSHRVISETIAKLGEYIVFDCVSLFMEIDFDGYDFWMLPDYAIRNVLQYLAGVFEIKTQALGIVDMLAVNINTKCSLNCSECSAFIPYIQHKQNYDIDKIIQNTLNLIEVFGAVRNFNIAGGEPLLHPQLPKLIQHLKEENRIESISVTSNGTLIPSDKLVEAMKSEPRFYFRISDYGAISSKKNELIAILSNNNIPYELTNYSYWNRGTKIGVVNETPEELRTKFLTCVSSCSRFMFDDLNFYLCRPCCMLVPLGAFPESKINYIALSGTTTQVLKSELMEYVKRKYTGEYLDACKYCSGSVSLSYEERIPVAEQTTELLSFPKIEAVK